MEELSYKQIVAAQRRISECRDQLASMIGYIDENGNRKLKKEHLLSAEVAAYKLTNSWFKQIRKGEDVLSADVFTTLSLIETLINLSKTEDFGDQEVVERYEELNMHLWSEVLKDREDQPLIEANREIAIAAALIEHMKGIESMYLEMEYPDLFDCSIMCSAYSVVHDWAMTLSEEEFARFTNEYQLNKLLFNIF